VIHEGQKKGRRSNGSYLPSGNPLCSESRAALDNLAESNASRNHRRAVSIVGDSRRLRNAISITGRSPRSASRYQAFAELPGYTEFDR
jgi:hypothetical protein